jgi:chromosome segregation ATPase
MADTEVENTLREIRERVLASAPARAAEHAHSRALTQNGDAFEALARMDANLSTTARAWSRLPPVLTKRRGALARFELWLKRLIKRAAHWFTWEQVNFNSAAHNALGDARAALDAHERALSHLREELGRVREELTGLRAEVESGASRAAELEARVSSAESRFDSRLAELQGALASGLDNLRGEQRARTEEFRSELRDRAEGLLEEQRVCFRQLSLEASELAVTQDRARRAVESRLEKLEQNREQ